MFKKFLILEWRAFTRSASFASNLAMKIIMGFAAAYFGACFIILGAAAYFLLKEGYPDPMPVVNRFLIYYFTADLLMRLLLQKIPVMNIRPLLALPIQRATIVRFSIGKTMVSFFNFLHYFALVPFFVAMLVDGRSPVFSSLWLLSMLSLVYVNNFLNILLNNKDNLFYAFLTLVLAVGGLQYYDVFDITLYTGPAFQALFGTYWAFLIPIALAIGLYMACFRYFMTHLRLDTGLSVKHAEATTENYDWLSKYGTVGTFLKNDLRLIRRNKRSKGTVGASIMFLFYGLAFFTGIVEVYDSPAWHMFAAIFITGGFLFTFGQFVPSWDSAYYNLMMTQNIPYKGYLQAKWWLIVLATIASTVLATPYLYFGANVYMMILCGAVYNIGVNSHLVLLGGAYTKTPIDLTSGKNAFGDKKAFNVKTMLISLPKLGLPVALYAIGEYVSGSFAGVALVAAAGIFGFALRDKVFNLVVKLYRTEKYSTIQAYKQKN